MPGRFSLDLLADACLAIEEEEAADLLRLPNVHMLLRKWAGWISKRRDSVYDLIIYHHRSTKPLENRWAFSEDVIDYDRISDLSERVQVFDVANLKRIKICGLPLADWPRLLNAFGPKNRLEQMDIDEFKIAYGTRLITPEFARLRTLSIERFCGVPQAETNVEINAENSQSMLVRFVAPVLYEVYLGLSIACLPATSSRTNLLNRPFSLPRQAKV